MGLRIDGHDDSFAKTGSRYYRHVPGHPQPRWDRDSGTNIARVQGIATGLPAGMIEAVIKWYVMEFQPRTGNACSSTVPAEKFPLGVEQATASMEYEAPNGLARVLPLTLEGVLRITSVQDAQGAKLPVIQEAREMDNDP